MKKLLIYVAAFLSIIITLALKSDLKNNCSTFLSLNFRGKILVYNNSSKQKVLKKIGHNLKDEDYIMFKIISSNNNMYFVEVSYAIAGKNIKGWINKDTKLAIFLKPVNKKIKIYDSYSKKSKGISIDYYSEEAEVINYHVDWLKIKVQVNNKIISGWLPPEEQCSNPYTTCN